MNPCIAFFEATHARFPALAEKADRVHLAYWGAAATEDLGFYSWFESIAKALNEEMRGETDAAQCRSFFEFVRSTFHVSSDEVKKCIDVSLVENMFWCVPPEKARAYWKILPPLLQDLYINFHRYPPA